jgi:hypothetical protein
MAIQGHSYEDITDDLKERFLDLIASGYTRPEAATALGASARQLRSLCNPQSHRYDDDFHRRYAKLTEKDGEHQHALVERLQTAAVERGLRSSDRLLEKLLVMYHPDWEIHRPQAMQMNFKVDEMKVLFAGLSDDTLQAMIFELEQKQQAQLPPADIDAA